MLRVGFSILCIAVALYASEDSIEAVLEGYESPQRLFTTESNANNAAPQGDLADSINAKNTESSIESSAPTQDLPSTPARPLSPRDMKPPINPAWIYSTAIIESHFIDGSFKKGLATLLKNGFFITSSEVIYNGKITPKSIYVKMQDDMHENMMCVAQLHIKALDLDAGLALLKVAKSADSYCNARAQSYYHDRIYKRFGIDVFASNANIPLHTQAYYPYLNSMFVFSAQSLELAKFASYYDFESRKEQIYGFEIQRDSYEEYTYGRAFYDKNGVFLGIMSRVGVEYLPVFVNRSVIQDFLCDVQDKEIIHDNFVQSACQRLGEKRQRFFTDMHGRASFY
ncbi:hypothetical protein [Helicobacter jaachi]|uniref:hypothetical protein n=1 Tax=Helicobacter jaachi TaxID=1677920 RepID=UPI001EE92178|nr:hypothetical protein [Helicobacter jaachi]